MLNRISRALAVALSLWAAGPAWAAPPAPSVPPPPPVGTTFGTVAAGNDSRIVGAVQSSTVGQPSGPAALDSYGRLNVVPATNAPGVSDGSVFGVTNFILPRMMTMTGGSTVGSANEFAAAFQATIASTSSAASYEKAVLYLKAINNDPSDYANSILRDVATIELQCVVANGNTAGRCWALNTVATVQAGADGYLAVQELAANNFASDQPLTGTTTAKNGLHMVGGGTYGGTAAIVLDGKWHDGLVCSTTNATDHCWKVWNGTNSVASLSPAGVIDATQFTMNNGGAGIGYSGTVANQALMLQPTGNGALIVGPKPDNTSTGGNVRGSYAVDLQTVRSAAYMVASGAYSFVAGNGNTASGGYAVAIGQQNTASGPASISLGGTGNVADGQYSGNLGGFGGKARGRWGEQFFASGLISVAGDAQIGTQVLRGTGATASAIRLTADGAAAGSANVVNLPSAAVGSYSLRLTLTALDLTNPANTYSWSVPIALLSKTGTAPSTTTLTLGTPVTLATNSWAPTVSATADTTNSGLNLSFTPPSGNTDTVHAVARVESVEVQ